MKKITLNHSNKLSKQLARYGALSLAIAGVAEASGQIVYTDVDPDFVGALQDSFLVDFNSDGVTDAGIVQDSFTPPGGAPIQVLAALPNTGNGIVANIISSFSYAVNVPLGTPISSGNTFGDRGDMCQGPGYPASNFCATTADGYIGVKFAAGANTHYGWVRIGPASSPLNFIVKDYAFNATPGAPINAGQTLGVDEFSSNPVKIVASDKTISLSNLTETTEYRVMDISGKTIMNGSTNGTSYVINANAVSNGIYVIELSERDSNSVIRKKIVL